MNLKEIKEIINLMNEHGLGEIEIEREGAKLKIKRALIENPPPADRPVAEYRVESQPSVQPVPAPPGEQKSSSRKTITSPMVGTFYLAPSPEAPSFVEIGQVVEVGQVVCIVEAMKLMNEIKSEIRGKIVEMPVSNADPVEFGQVLFALEPV